MKTVMMGYARQAGRRARTQARRLGAILKQYQTNPERYDWRYSEAAALRAGYPRICANPKLSAASSLPTAANAGKCSCRAPAPVRCSNRTKSTP